VPRDGFVQGASSADGRIEGRRGPAGVALVSALSADATNVPIDYQRKRRSRRTAQVEKSPAGQERPPSNARRGRPRSNERGATALDAAVRETPRSADTTGAERHAHQPTEYLNASHHPRG
jgi:hypothetical protein